MKTFMKQMFFIALVSFLTTPFSYAQFNKALNEFKSLKKEVQKTGNEVKQTTSSSAKTGSSSTAANKEATNENTNSGREWYINIAIGSGKEGTIEKPAKEIAAIALQLKPGDVIYIAEGIYKGKADMSSDIITVPVSIIGGYNQDFTKRDPWGNHKTVLSGVNGYMKSETTSRLSLQCSKSHKDYSGQVLIDGLIIDNGSRNFYLEGSNEGYIKRKASPQQGFNPTPDSPGIEVDMGSNANVVIRNCALMNIAASQGVIDVQVGKNGKVLIENNLIVNNTGDGINAKTSWQSADGQPEYNIRNNTVLFCSKYDEAASNHGGNSLKVDERIVLIAENNVFAFNDYGGLDNIKKCKSITLNNNLFTANKKYDYREYNTPMAVADMADYADFATGEGNENKTIQVPVSKEWSAIYMSRVVPEREEIDSQVTVQNSGANAWRSMLGLPLQGTSVGALSQVWLNRIQTTDALKAGMQTYHGKGCVKPE
ncbi:MAG: right-handed parallel beta-helix repeat-containing protein [Sphingobacteriales bacterium]|nr:MAG: right-handed parallel beta-helix repeat-containing protein [Sphingobacteriales bacterium]